MLWPLDQVYYPATVTRFRGGKHDVVYHDDGATESIDLSQESWRVAAASGKEGGVQMEDTPGWRSLAPGLPSAGLLDVDEQGTGIYRVEALLASRPKKGTSDGSRQFLVRWSEYGAEDDSWEDESNIIDRKLIRAFERAAKVPASPSAGRQSARDGGSPGADGTSGSGTGYLDGGGVHRMRVGSAYQAAPDALPQPLLLDRSHGAASSCGCARCASRAEGSLHAHAPPCPPPHCHCGRRAMWIRQLFWCESGRCSFEWHPHFPSEPVLLHHRQMEISQAQSTAALLTAHATGPMNAWSFVAPSDFDLGLFARVPLRSGQAISEYSGPRLPELCAGHPEEPKGDSVLQVPGTQYVIDGKSQNTPFPCPLSPATFANHSARPNAHLEVWSLPRPGTCDLRQQLMLVSSEPIAAGHEIRIDYEDGAPVAGTYWGVQGAPRETAWRGSLVHPPPCVADAEPVCQRLQQLQAAAASGQPAPWIPEVEPRAEAVAWEGPSGGDARLRNAVPLLRSNWSLVATHVPGRTGVECRDRWRLLQERSLQESATTTVAESLNLLREHRAAEPEEQDDDMEATGADDDNDADDADDDNDADDADDDSPRPWTRDDDELLRKLAAARAGPPSAKRDEGGKEKAAQLDMHEWGEVAEHFDDRTPLECAHRYQKLLSPDHIKGARRR